jgi:beta-lactamase class A
MDLFGRKKKKREEEEEEARIEEEKAQIKLDQENKKLKKKLKDLAPENSRKRKEPPKPWGKKERFTVGGFFLLTTLIAAILFLDSHEYKFPGLPKIAFKGVSLSNPFGEKVFELGQKSVFVENDDTATLAIDSFNEHITPLSGFYGFYVVRLADGSSYGVSSDKSFQGASMIKLPLMVLIYRLSEMGELDLNTDYVLKEEDKVPGAGILLDKPAGSTFTYRELLSFMGKNSDRTAYKVMKDVVTEERYVEFLPELGLRATDIRTGMTTPADMANLFSAVWDGTLLAEESRDELLNNLTDTDFEKWIAKGVPKGVRVMHKYGADAGVVNDGGIIDAENPFVLVIMGQGITARDAESFYSKFANDIYNLENNVQ